MPSWSPELQFASRCVAEACRLVSQTSEPLWVARKNDGSVVTDADYAFQALGDLDYPAKNYGK